MDLKHYVFRTVWEIDVPPETLFEILANVPNYPKWFPLIKEVKTTGYGKFSYRCRSILPYDLEFDTAQTVVDEDKGILEASMEGDLVGFSRWTITPRGEFSTVEYFEEADTNKALLNLLAPVAKPLFKLNHWIAMIRGRSGLRTYAAGYVEAHSPQIQKVKHTRKKKVDTD